MITDYGKQANDFLTKFGITFNAKFVDSSCPPFCDSNKHIHGNKYKIILSRPLTQKKISFSFWNSYNDSQSGKEPSAYDVLSCCASGINCPDNFKDFCAEFGYDVDSIKTLKTFKLCVKQAEKLNNLFNTEAMVAELQNIQ